MKSVWHALLKAAQFSRQDILYALIFTALMVPVHELLHAFFLILFGCHGYIYFDPSVYPIMRAGFVQTSCSLSYFQQKAVSLAPDTLLGITGLAMVILGYTKTLEEHRKIVQGTARALRHMGARKAYRGTHRGFDALVDDISRENIVLERAAHTNLMFWGIVFIAAVLFSIVLHILLPISTDWDVWTCAPAVP